jgi:hypothetical protein
MVAQAGRVSIVDNCYRAGFVRMQPASQGSSVWFVQCDEKKWVFAAAPG